MASLIASIDWCECETFPTMLTASQPQIEMGVIISSERAANMAERVPLDTLTCGECSVNFSELCEEIWSFYVTLLFCLPGVRQHHVWLWVRLSHHICTITCQYYYMARINGARGVQWYHNIHLFQYKIVEIEADKRTSTLTWLVGRSHTSQSIMG